MPWNAARHAGFTAGEPWLPVADDYPRLNVEAEQADAASMLNLYRRLLALRARSKAIRYGHYTPAYADERVLCYVRDAGDERLLVALNFSGDDVELNPKAGAGRVVVSTHGDQPRQRSGEPINLRRHEGQVVALE